MLASDNLRIVPIPPELVAPVLPAALPFVLKGLATADEDLSRLSEELMEGLSVLWCVFSRDEITGAFFTAVHASDDGEKFITLYGLSGRNVHAWAVPVRETVEKLGRVNGCTVASFFGRAGWSRFYPEYDREQVGSNVWHYRRALQ